MDPDPRSRRRGRRPDPAGDPAPPADDQTETLNDAPGAARGASSAAPFFDAGAIVSGRYRIVRFLARGGAGEVYEAWDLELESRVALKAIRPGHTSENRIARFKREVQLARQVTHPNVCRIYELGHETHAAGDVLFLTMEYLEGETLLERIDRGGPLPAATALPLVRQMAAGLRAAQQAGIVHRDFKSGNVMLVPDPASEGGLRAVITDFGLAKATSEDDRGRRVTGHNLLVGTPAYMAPEQVAGEPVSAATDLYAFGVVLFEMLTGRTPFDSESGLGTAFLRLREPPPSPRTWVPDLDERWERAILRCLERDPADRFSGAHEVVTALAAERPDAGGRPAANRRRRLRILAAALAVAVAALAGAGFLRWRSSPAGAVAPARPSVALLGFRNLSAREDAAWLSTAFEEMLATEAAAGDQVRVVPGDEVARVRIELGLDEGGRLTSDGLRRVGKILGSELVVAGSYLLAGDRELRLDVQVREARGGEVVATISDRGTEAGVLDLVARVGEELRRALGVDTLSAADTAAVRAALPGGPASARLYARGLRALRRYDARGARELLEEAAESDPENPLIHSALSTAWAALGYLPKAQQAAQRAFELSDSLGQRDRSWVEARYHDIAGDRQRAASIYALLWDLFPDDLEVGLQLAKTQTGLGLAQAALDTVAALRAGVRDDSAGLGPRLDVAEAEAARALSRYDLQQTRAAAAAAAAKALGARLLAARAREVEAGAWRELGEPDKALAAYREARAIYEFAGNRGQVARTLIADAKIHRQQGRFDEARGLLDEALAVAREIGDQGSAQHALNTLAVILRQQGDLAAARAMHEQELAVSREIGDRQSIAVTLASLGTVEHRMGEHASARRRFEEALAISRDTGHKRSTAINLNLLGQILSDQGRLAEARRHFEEALALNDETGSRRGRAYYLASLGSVALASGDLAAARSRHLEAFAIRRELGERTNVAYSLLDLAALDLEEGRPYRAAVRARAAAAEFAMQRKEDAQGLAEATLARVWLALGRIGEAQSAIQNAQSLVAASEDRRVPLEVAMRSAEVAAAAGRTGEARRRLRSVIAEAESLGLVPLRLEAGILLGALELRSAERAAGHRRLRAIVEEASALGCDLLARRASARLAEGG